MAARMLAIGSTHFRLREAKFGDPKVVFLFATDPPNVVEHYDDCFGAMQDQFPDSAMVVFELPGFGLSRSGQSSLDGLAQDLAYLIRQIKEEHSASKLVLIMPCVSALFCPVVFGELPQGTVDYLVVVQCADYAGELRWANGVNSRGMLSLPILARLYNYLNAKAISANWYMAPRLPASPSFFECFGGPPHVCFNSRLLGSRASKHPKHLSFLDVLRPRRPSRNAGATTSAVDARPDLKSSGTPNHESNRETPPPSPPPSPTTHNLKPCEPLYHHHSLARFCMAGHVCGKLQIKPLLSKRNTNHQNLRKRRLPRATWSTALCKLDLRKPLRTFSP